MDSKTRKKMQRIASHMQTHCANCASPTTQRVHMGGQWIGTITLCRSCKITMLAEDLARASDATGRNLNDPVVRSGIRRFRQETGMQGRSPQEIEKTAQTYARTAHRIGHPDVVARAITAARTAARDAEAKRLPHDRVVHAAWQAGTRILITAAIDHGAAKKKTTV